VLPTTESSSARAPEDSEQVPPVADLPVTVAATPGEHGP
jgi:hypothetical protein